MMHDESNANVPTARVDVVIFGGGCAGLWLVNRLTSAGYGTVLLEADALGTGQTIWSQGIIHGGMKYALTGEMTRAARMIAEMPGVWRDCLNGGGEIDLTAAQVLSDHQYLWTSKGIASKLGAFAASKVLRAAPRPVDSAARPAPFDDAPSGVSIYRMDEPVLAMAPLLEALRGPCAHVMLKIDGPDGVQFEQASDGSVRAIGLRDEAGRSLRIVTSCVVLTAGAGNESLCRSLGVDGEAMQRRPLHQVLVKGRLPMLFGHCIGGLSDKPRLTITSIQARDGETVWNVGGELAEAGVARSPSEQCDACRRELQRSLPWVDFESIRLSSGMVDRAEPRQHGGRRPDVPFAQQTGNILTAWPTKLAFAPRLAGDVVKMIESAGIEPTPPDLEAAKDWPAPSVAIPPWEEFDREWI